MVFSHPKIRSFCTCVFYFSFYYYSHLRHSQAAENGATPSQTEAHTHYCPMHLEETGFEGDNCPICGMHLVPIEEGSSPEHDHKHEMPTSSPPSENIDSTPIYICPMHPHISGEESDTCPICGMNLVPKKTDQGHEEHTDKPEGAFQIDPSYRQTLGVKTAEVIHHEFGKNIRAFGNIAPSTRLERSVDVRTTGWIVDLAVDAVGDTVKKGDLLFTYYSPI